MAHAAIHCDSPQHPAIPVEAGIHPANHNDLSVTREDESAVIQSGATDCPPESGVSVSFPEIGQNF